MAVAFAFAHDDASGTHDLGGMPATRLEFLVAVVTAVTVLRPAIVRGVVGMLPPAPVGHRYRRDTEGGSSSSPVLSRRTHKVIGLHHYGGCPNHGVRIDLVAARIGLLP